jgi:general secretion pathway protein K
MKITIQSNRSGIALIIVLVVILALGILAIGFGSAMKVETTLARHASFNSELDWLGRSGVEYARWVLSQVCPGEPYESLNQVWAGGPGGICTNNDVQAEIQVGNGSFTWKITDLDRKFNINRADEMILRQALTLVGVDAGSMTTIVGSILDWRDVDSQPHMSGAETDVYEQQDPPYMAKDGPFDDMSELLLIRGVTPAMYWGAKGGDLPQIFNRPQPGLKSNFEEPSYAVGLADLFTPLSGPGVNINTASATVLQLIPVIDENIAQAIIQRRAGPDGQDGTFDDTPFRNPAEVSVIPGIPPGALQQFTSLFSTRSQIFQVEVTATIGGSKREYVAIVRRAGTKDTVVLNLYWR